MVSGEKNKMMKFFQHDLIWFLARIYVFFVLKKRGVNKKLQLISEKMIWTLARIYVFYILKVKRRFELFRQKQHRLISAMGIVTMLFIIVSFPFILGNSDIQEATANVESEDPYYWIQNEQFVAHGMGGVDDVFTTNSLDAFIANYQEGCRIFEVDLTFTSDKVLVLRHDNGRYVFNDDGTMVKKDDPMTYDEFREDKPNGTLTTLSFEDLVKIMRQFPDVRIIIDTKTDDPEIVQAHYEQISSIINEYDPSLMSRVTPQFYNEAMYEQMSNAFKFETYIYTMYLGSGETGGVVDFMARNNLKIITIPDWMVTGEFLKELDENGIYSFVHTVDTLDRMNELEEMGVDGFYTDAYAILAE